MGEVGPARASLVIPTMDDSSSGPRPISVPPLSYILLKKCMLTGSHGQDQGTQQGSEDFQQAGSQVTFSAFPGLQPCL